MYSENGKLPDQFPLILIDATASVSGGAVYLLNLLLSWTRSTPRFRFVVFHTKDLDLTGIRDRVDWITFREVAIPGFFARNWLVGSVLKMLWRAFILPIHLWFTEPDVLFSNSGTLPGFVPHRVKSVIAIHNSMPFQPDQWIHERSWIRRLRLALLHRQSTRTLSRGVECIVFSQDLRMRVVQMGGREDQCTVIHHGIEWGEKERTSAISKDLEVGDIPYLLYVSQLHRYKNVARLLEAFSRLNGNYPDIQLVIVGHLTDREYAVEISSRIHSLGLNHSVKIVPGAQRSELIEYYRQSIGIVYPSLVENCPFPLLESMAMGKPIAASRIGAIREVCADAAIYFDPYYPEDMAIVMEELVSNEGLRLELSARALIRAEAFTWEDASRRTLEIFDNLVPPKTKKMKKAVDRI
jgi:glycosyltransferase involved in cell wall biosynthesis